MDIHNYHWIWYIFGFLIVPRITLAVLVCQYLPISLVAKIFISFMAFFCDGTKVGG